MPELTCTYPKCSCPFDAPADPNWCARGLPHIAPSPIPGRLVPPGPYSCDGTRCPSRNNCLRHEEPGNGPKAALWARREPGATACDQYRAVKVLTTFKEPSQ